jgi:hypothetical protein
MQMSFGGTTRVPIEKPRLLFVEDVPKGESWSGSIVLANFTFVIPTRAVTVVVIFRLEALTFTT